MSEVHGLATPGNPQVPEQYSCTTDEGKALFFDGDASVLLGAEFSAGSDTRLALTSQAMASDGHISVQRAMVPGAAAVGIGGGGRRKLTIRGTKRVLVIRLVSSSGTYAPTQSEAKMHDDVFVDENNLVSIRRDP
jgi:hypothetical protein